MNRIVAALSKLLEPEDREFACGDLEELRISAPAAAANILGLVIRRQRTEWSRLRPWAGLLGVAGLTGLLPLEPLVIALLFALVLGSRAAREGTLPRNMPLCLAAAGLALVVLLVWMRSWLQLVLPTGAADHISYGTCLSSLTVAGRRVAGVLNSVFSGSKARDRPARSLKIIMMNTHLKFLLVALSCAGFATCGGAATIQAALTIPGARIEAPPFRLADASGVSKRLADYRGKVVVLNFWATDCRDAAWRFRG